jgi:hypothetical protein
MQERVVRLSRLQADEDEMAISRTKVGILQHLLSIQYLMDRMRFTKSARFFLDILPQLERNRYRHFLRISPLALQKLTALIEHHPIFHASGVFEQAPVQKQLAVDLRRFAGEYSSSGWVISTAQMFGIGEGTVVLYTRRICTVLMDIL